MDLLVWSAYFFAGVFVINVALEVVGAACDLSKIRIVSKTRQEVFILYAVELEAFNYAAVFGVCLGIYIIINLDVLVRSALTFVKGWRN